jgi:hypothetical protein
MGANGNPGKLMIEAGGSLSIADNVNVGPYSYPNGNVIENAGTLNKTGSGVSQIGTSGNPGVVAFNNDAGGVVNVQGGELVLSGPTVMNAGVLKVTGGHLFVQGQVTGTGTGEISGSEMLEFGGAVASGQAVSFDAGSTGTLRLDSSQTFSGTVARLAYDGTNFLDLSDISYGANTKANFSGTTAGGTLQVTDGTRTANIHLVGDYTASTFVTATDGHGGTLIHDPTQAVALLVQSMASFAPSGGAGSVAALLPPSETQQTLLTQPHT